MVIFTLHRYGRSLGLDALILARMPAARTNGAAAGGSRDWLRALA